MEKPLPDLMTRFLRDTDSRKHPFLGASGSTDFSDEIVSGEGVWLLVTYHRTPRVAHRGSTEAVKLAQRIMPVSVIH